MEAIQGVLDDMIENAEWVLGVVKEHAMQDPSLFGDEDVVRAVAVLKEQAEAARKAVG